MRRGKLITVIVNKVVDHESTPIQLTIGVDYDPTFEFAVNNLYLWESPIDCDPNFIQSKLVFTKALKNEEVAEFLHHEIGKFQGSSKSCKIDKRKIVTLDEKEVKVIDGEDYVVTRRNTYSVRAWTLKDYDSQLKRDQAEEYGDWGLNLAIVLALKNPSSNYARLEDMSLYTFRCHAQSHEIWDYRSSN